MTQKNCKNILFENRAEVARQLLELLPTQQMKKNNWIVIAVSSGGFEIALALAKKLKLDVDLLFNEAIMSPVNSECEIARVSETEEIVIHELLVHSFEIQNDYIFGQAKRMYEDKILPDIYKFRKDSAFCSLYNRNVLLLDEGSETGMKLMVGIKSALEMKAKAIYVVAPVMPDDIVDNVNQLVDDVFCLYEVKDYLLTASYYNDFPLIEDEELAKLFEEKDKYEQRDKV
ncbi:MAG: hypothetical protein KU37_08245 [Sulfuricurvum sp. PC08-66]|nr:MAG: hypothetical protein KU37_08245 [Sulfuricurvum sp. PC08-66]